VGRGGAGIEACHLEGKGAVSEDMRLMGAGQAVPSGEPGFKWAKEKGTLRGDAEDTRLFAGV